MTEDERGKAKIGAENPTVPEKNKTRLIGKEGISGEKKIQVKAQPKHNQQIKQTRRFR